MTYALEHLDEQVDVGILAEQVHMSRRTFDRRFHALTGSSPLQWLAQQRILHAQRLLEDTDLSIDAVAREVGPRDRGLATPAFRHVARRVNRQALPARLPRQSRRAQALRRYMRTASGAATAMIATLHRIAAEHLPGSENWPP